MNRSLIRTIEEKQANNEDNISLIKKQVKKAWEKVAEMEERQRRAIMWIIGVLEGKKQNDGTDLIFKISIQESVLYIKR